jgi:hypothetical protein
MGLLILYMENIPSMRISAYIAKNVLLNFIMAASFAIR